MSEEKQYMNVNTGSVDSKDGWRNKGYDPVKSGEVVEVEFINDEWTEV